MKSDSIVLVAAKIKSAHSCHETALAELISDPAAYKGNQEHYLQTELFYRLSIEFPVIYEMAYATPNGGLRDNTTASKMKREGQKSGYPDLCIDIPTHDFHGFKLEVKREESVSSVSNSQLEWQRKHSFFNYKTSIEFDYEACWKAILNYITIIYKERPKPWTAKTTKTEGLLAKRL